MNKTLEELRKEIDEIDEELLNILSKRMDVVRAIGKVKKENNRNPLDEKRWNDVLERIKSKSKNLSISEELVKKIYDEIHDAALKIEKEL